MTVEMTGRNKGCEGWTAVKRQPALHAKRFGVRNDSSAFGRQPEIGAGALAPETAIQPGPVAVNISDYKSVQVNITNKKNSRIFNASPPATSDEPKRRQAEKWRQKNVLLPSFCPRLSASPSQGRVACQGGKGEAD
jgi:hypothetical protein